MQSQNKQIYCFLALLFLLLFSHNVNATVDDLIDEMLWDKDVLKVMKKEVENGEQSEPYALRYYEWLKQREKVENEKQQKKIDDLKQGEQDSEKLAKTLLSYEQLSHNQNAKEQTKQIQEAILEQLAGLLELEKSGQQHIMIVTIPGGADSKNPLQKEQGEQI